MTIDAGRHTDDRAPLDDSRLPMPALFVSHGAPTLALDASGPVDRGTAEAATAFDGSRVGRTTPSHGDTARRLAELGRRIGRPKAILIASAHWATRLPMLGGASAPATVHDFGGFAPELQRIRYPAPGSPALAAQAQGLLAAAGFEAGIDPSRGLDHGGWVPLLHMYPDADVPVVQLSVQPGFDASHHVRVGRALAPMAAEGVLVVGSGGATHNLREAFAHRRLASEAPWARAFADWIHAQLETGDTAALLDWQARAPDALRNHPTDEHLLPLFVALGAAGAQPSVERVHRGGTWGALALDAWRFDRRRPSTGR